MSIYIKDMEKPENCCACPCYNYEYGKCQIEGNWGKGYVYNATPDWCPLIPVPEHGRLIDADALSTYDKPIGKLMMFGGEYVYTQTAIDNAPTIIPADPQKEETWTVF